MRFHLIDRIESFEAEKSVRARKVTSFSEEYWEERDGVLQMPPPFVLEALCQAATWLIIISTEYQSRAALLQVGSVDWHAPVRPGDVLRMEGGVDSFGGEAAVVSGRVTVDGVTVLEAKNVMCALIAADTLADLDDTRRLREMLAKGSET